MQKIESLDNCMVIFLNGYIDTYNSSFFQKRVAKVIESGYVQLVFNCASLNYVSSAIQANAFPQVFACPICSKKLKATKPGRFRCSECKTILAIDGNARVFLG